MLLEMTNFHSFLWMSSIYMGFPGSSHGKQSAFYAGDPSLTLGQKDPLEEGMATHSSTLA